MTHEPECTNKAKNELVRLNGVFQIPNNPCICSQLHVAYKRGRRDAADAAFEWLTDDTRHTDQSLIDACTGDDQ